MSLPFWGVWMQRFHLKNSDLTELQLSLPCSAALPRFRCRFKTGASQVQPAWYILISIDIQRLTWLTVDPGDAGPGKNKKLSHQGTIVCSSMVSIFTRSASLWNQRPRICCFLKMTFTAGKRRIQRQSSSCDHVSMHPNNITEVHWCGEV